MALGKLRWRSFSDQKQKFLEYLRGNFKKLLFFTVMIALEIGLFMYAYEEYLQKASFKIVRSVVGKTSFSIAKASAFMISVNSSVIILTMCRVATTFLWNLPLLRWIPFQHAKRLHMTLAWFIILFSLLHYAAHMFNYLNLAEYLESTGREQPGSIIGNAEKWSIFHGTGLTGQIALIALFLILSTSFRNIRTKSYEVFLYSHYLFLVFFLAICLHGAFCFIKSDPPESKCLTPSYYIWVLPSLAVLALEKLYVVYRSRLYTKVVRVVLHPSEVIQLQFKKPSLRFQPGQYVNLKCPSVSWLQWHPFTITSAPEEEYVSVHVRVVGNWTRELANLVGANEEDKKENQVVAVMESPRILIDGPYGAASQDVFKYEIVVCIGAGIGQTPFSSILKHICFQERRNEAGRKIKKLYYIGIFRSPHSFEWFHGILKELEAADVDHLVEFSSYLTGPMDEDRVRNVMINDISGCDAITGLRNATQFGRPNLESIFSNFREWHQGSVVGVFFCGPASLSKKIAKICKTKTDGKTKFEYNKENF